jgi:hypothetical protein
MMLSKDEVETWWCGVPLQDEYFRRSRGQGLKFSPYAKKEIADFSQRYHQLRWDVDFVGVQVSSSGARVWAWLGSEGFGVWAWLRS